MDNTPTRGLTVRAYKAAFNAGARSGRKHPDLDLDERLALYTRYPKSPEQEHAWLDGNTYFDTSAAEHLKAREELGGNY